MNYYRISLVDRSELVIQNDLFEKTDDFIKQINQGVFDSGYIKLTQVNIERERSPVYYNKSSVLSIEKISDKLILNDKGNVSSSTKLWEIAK